MLAHARLLFTKCWYNLDMPSVVTNSTVFPEPLIIALEKFIYKLFHKKTKTCLQQLATGPSAQHATSCCAECT